MSKIEKLSSEITKKERLITTLENQKETLVGQMASKEKSMSEIRKETSSEKLELADKIE